MARRESTPGVVADSEPRTLPQVLAFMRVLWSVVHRMDRLSKQMASETGVTGPQRLVLRLLDLHPGISAGELATLLHLHPSTLTGILQRLEGARLLSRTPDAADRRRSVLRLTSAGTRVSRRERGTVEAAVADTLERVSARDRDTTCRLLDVLGRCLDTELSSSPGAPIEAPARPTRRKRSPA